MANLKINQKTEFLYLEENYTNKLVEYLNTYEGQKVLFVADTASHKDYMLYRNLLKCKVYLYKKNCDENEINETMSEHVTKNNLNDFIEEVMVIFAIGDDNEINIAKQIAHKFNKPYIIVFGAQNNSLCFSEFYVQNFEIKKGFLPLGVIVDLKEDVDIWQQKFIVENTKIQTLKCIGFFNELFLNKRTFCEKIDSVLQTTQLNSKHEIVEKFCDLALFEQREKEYYSLYLLLKIYFELTKSERLNHEFLLYKSLIKTFEAFTNNFMSKFKCFKCYDLIQQNDAPHSVNSVYIKYILSNFYGLIQENLNNFYKEIDVFEEKLNYISFSQMYKDKQLMSSRDILKAFKIFSKIQKSSSYLTIIDFYGLF